MSRCIYDGIVPLLSLRPIGGASDLHTSLVLFPLPVHIECKDGRALTSLSVSCFSFSTSHSGSPPWQNKPPSGGALPTVDMAACDKGDYADSSSCSFFSSARKLYRWRLHGGWNEGHSFQPPWPEVRYPIDLPW